MAITRTKKEEIVKDLTENFRKANAVIFIDYTGLSVNDTQELRRKLAEAKALFKVAKKTLIRIVLKRAGLKIDPEKLPGQLGLVFECADEVGPIKIVNGFYKEKETPKFVGGILDNEFIAGDSLEEIATLPSVEELRAKLVYLFVSPLSSLLQIFSGPGRNLVCVLSQIKEGKGSK